MKKILALALFALTACGTVPVKYDAQNYYRVPTDKKTSVSVGEFLYQPFKDGKVAANQIHNTAMGRVYISTNVADYVKRANALELEKSGFGIADGKKLEIQANVLDFTADDLGYSIDWTYKINYKIYDNDKKSYVFEKTFDTPEITTGKFGLPSDFTSSINDKILAGYDAFIKDEEAQKLLLGE